ncbi:TPA: hypothetical protein GRI80_06140 [Vibrio parahaemolyticus]|uniref:Uncharacterized protein n=2 Tax=Vibrio harveyi group TaxID=717610 RepID=A7N7Y5_VIBC1|nr:MULTISPECIES: hypothetical protein [Vibrio harveyi group]ABU74942.1 hypothetical protein VIBHAR_07069 [Vibrio campbellii ATCC BAA-1116]AGU98988.1 hypothetical protein M892_27620 [Vibrio campbellii ATCC BAA-1116]EGQ7715736.1 hypothetical protein [Vibrio parahaemolyticus]EGQ7722841.1 hypothetical protein [Vibrio parahaemolyticus]EGQ7728835.1 hypothetical protein [Vibrio parahaemolyticus]
MSVSDASDANNIENILFLASGTKSLLIAKMVLFEHSSTSCPDDVSATKTVFVFE